MKKHKINLKKIDVVVTILGVSLLIVGLYQIYPPLAWITAGIILAFPELPRKVVK